MSPYVTHGPWPLGPLKLCGITRGPSTDHFPTQSLDPMITRGVTGSINQKLTLHTNFRLKPLCTVVGSVQLERLKSRVHLYLRDRWSDHLRVGLVLTVSCRPIRPDQLFDHQTSVSRPKGEKSKSRGSRDLRCLRT